MRLVDLKPRWIHEHVFIFMCPHCVQTKREFLNWLSCKTIQMDETEQMDLFVVAMKDEEHKTCVGTRKDVAWALTSKDFETMSVSPSIDHSPSGNWHGFIQGGNIT